jgi:putative ABC transport system substrate-binding protein
MLISKGLTGDVRMRRREFLAVLGGAAAWPLATRAQQAGRIYRIGVLAPEVPPPGLLETFQDELRALGYVEGKNVAIESRHAGGKNERLATLADELVRLGVDIILAVNTQAAQAAKKATATIPIVITRVTDPVKTGLVDSFARPGGNITGMSNMLEAINAKRLQLLKEILPGLAHVAVLWDIGNPGATVVVDDMETVSARLGLDMLRVPVHGPADFPDAFDVAVRGRAQAVIIFVTR